jgi:Fe-S cluster assembly protein SufD
MAKMIASGRGRAVFQGLVVVHKEAPGTDAVQLNKNLVLSKRARIDSLPRLEILPNEVSCKHGSATGEIDARQIYYLGTRGLSEEQARALVLQGFALEGIGALPSENVLFAVAEEVVTGLVARIAKV